VREHVVGRQPVPEHRSGTGPRRGPVGETPAHGAILDLQRLGGNRAVTQHLRGVRLRGQTARPSEPLLLQRALDEDWRADSGRKTRSKELKAVDAAVQTWSSHGNQLPGATDLNIAQLGAILTAIVAWKKKASAKNPRHAGVDKLRKAVVDEKTRFEQIKLEKQKDEAEARQHYDEFVKMDPELTKFAKRNVVDVKPERFREKNRTPMLMALAQPRDAAGRIQPGGISAIETELRNDEAGYMNIGRSGKLDVDPSLTTTDVEGIAKSDENPLTKKTRYPELENYTNPNTEPSGEVTESKTLGGVTVSVTYDKSDVHAVTRLSYLEAALDKVTKAGFAVHALRVYLPKYGRSLSVSKDCNVVAKGSKVPDAVFVAPDFLLLSSSGVDNPKEERTTSGKLKFLSAELDPSGVGTVVHELGHALHYKNDPAKFHGLAFSMFSGKDKNGRSYQDWSKEVSEYGNSPREMVAEVFLGIVYQKTFPPEIMEIYKTFGGASTPSKP